MELPTYNGYDSERRQVHSRLFEKLEHTDTKSDKYEKKTHKMETFNGVYRTHQWLMNPKCQTISITIDRSGRNRASKIRNHIYHLICLHLELPLLAGIGIYQIK